MAGLNDNLGNSMQDELLRILGSANDTVGTSVATTLSLTGTWKEFGGDRQFGADLIMGQPVLGATTVIAATYTVNWLIQAATSANTTGMETVALITINPTNIQFSTTCGTTFLSPFRLMFRTPTGKKFIRTTIEVANTGTTGTTLIMQSVSVLINPIHDTVV